MCDSMCGCFYSDGRTLTLPHWNVRYAYGMLFSVLSSGLIREKSTPPPPSRLNSYIYKLLVLAGFSYRPQCAPRFCPICGSSPAGPCSHKHVSAHSSAVRSNSVSQTCVGQEMRKITFRSLHFLRWTTRSWHDVDSHVSPDRAGSGQVRVLFGYWSCELRYLKD